MSQLFWFQQGNKKYHCFKEENEVYQILEYPIFNPENGKTRLMSRENYERFLVEKGIPIKVSE